MTNAFEISQTAIFLWQGLMSVLGWSAQERTFQQIEAYDRHFGDIGQTGGAWSISLIASHLEEEFQHWKDHEFPTVYHYDIIEPLGEWLAKEGPSLAELEFNKPSIEQIVARYNEMMAGWLAEDALTNPPVQIQRKGT